MTALASTAKLVAGGILTGFALASLTVTLRRGMHLFLIFRIVAWLGSMSPIR